MLPLEGVAHYVNQHDYHPPSRFCEALSQRLPSMRVSTLQLSLLSGGQAGHFITDRATKLWAANDGHDFSARRKGEDDD